MRTDWTQGKVPVGDGIKLFYTRTGQGEKPALVLAHGLTDNGLCWHQLASDLEADYDVIMYDAYGHGKSSRINPEKRFDLAADLHDLIEALKLEKPGLIGHSLGAATAAEYAAQHPSKPAALILEDPPWLDEKIDLDEAKRTLKDWKKRNLAAKKKTEKELLKLKKKEAPNWEEDILPEWAQAKHEVDPAIFEQLSGIYEWKKLAKAIVVPTLIITGDVELGAIVSPQLGIEAIQLLEKGEFGHISEAGHRIRYEQYQPYLTMVKLFLKRNMSA